MDHKAALQEAVSEIFENMAFQELTPIAKNPLPSQVLWSFRQATMTIYSPIQGALVMTISPTMTFRSRQHIFVSVDKDPREAPFLRGFSFYRRVLHG